MFMCLIIITLLFCSVSARWFVLTRLLYIKSNDTSLNDIIENKIERNADFLNVNGILDDSVVNSNFFIRALK